MSDTHVYSAQYMLYGSKSKLRIGIEIKYVESSQNERYSCSSLRTYGVIKIVICLKTVKRYN